MKSAKKKIIILEEEKNSHNISPNKKSSIYSPYYFIPNKIQYNSNLLLSRNRNVNTFI